MNRLSQHLGIPALGDPPDYYRLLGVARYEPSDPVIAEAVQELSSRIRRDQHAFPEESQRLLNAIVEAKLCLMNPVRREQHDAAIRTEDDPHESSVMEGYPAPGGLSARLQGAGQAGEDPGDQTNLSAGSWLIQDHAAPEVSIPNHDTDEWLVGSGSECDFRIRTRWVSRRHCQLHRRGGKTVIADLGSKNGTYLNGVLINEPVPLLDGDRVSLGTRVWLPRPLPEPGQRRDVRLLLIGRSKHNDLVLDDKSVSKHHAQLVDDGQTVILFDLNSRNGIRVGGVGERLGRVEVLEHLPFFFGRAKRYGAELIDLCRAGD